MVYQNFLKNKNSEWLPYIQDFVKSYNNTYHTTIRMTPAELYNNSTREEQREALNTIRESARQSLLKTRSKAPELEVGDYVRLQVDLKPTLLRKQIGQKRSRAIYQIVEKQSAKKYRNKQYRVEKVIDKDGNSITPEPVSRLQYASRMQKIDINNLRGNL